MALESLFRIDEKFSNLSFVRNVRRDPELGKQLYLVGRNDQYPRKACLSFLQAIGGCDKISCFTFLKPKLNTRSLINNTTPGCAVDERQKMLYLLFRRGEEGIFLKLFHLTYQTADKFGYRRIDVKNGRGTCVNVFGQPSPQASLVPLHLMVAPSGPLVTKCLIEAFDVSNPDNWRAAVFRADVNFNQTQNVLSNVTASPLAFMAAHPMKMAQAPPVFSRLNDLLIWHSFPLSALDVEMLIAGDDGCLTLSSYIAADGHFNTLKIDPVALVKDLLPRNIFDGFYAAVPSATPKHIQFGNALWYLGDMHKFVLFIFARQLILAAKWPKDWYKQAELPPIRVSQVIGIDKQKKWGQINAACLVETDLYLRFKLGDAQVVRRMDFGHKFKDYRYCAFCDKQENRKKKNKDGKRVAKFKVCRICKGLNFHLYSDPELACWYCSVECVRKHWKEHKIIHEKNPKDRK